MRLANLGYTLGLSAAVATLFGCGGLQPPIGAPGTSGTEKVSSRHLTFRYTGTKQSFVVPTGVESITVVARGAGGGKNGYLQGGGRGGRVDATVPVTPGETLAVFVGGEGLQPAGGFNGGGNGGGGDQYDEAYGGGGASDVRRGGDSRRDRVMVAGGGGGQGGLDDRYCTTIGQGGNGGGSTARSGQMGYTPRCYPSASGLWPGYGGTGGTQRTGGAGGIGGGGYAGDSGNPGQPAVRGRGGAGGYGCVRSSCYTGPGGSGGGGGGGYFGGGGGGVGGGGYSALAGVKNANTVVVAAARLTSSQTLRT